MVSMILNVFLFRCCMCWFRLSCSFGCMVLLKMVGVFGDLNEMFLM